MTIFREFSVRSGTGWLDAVVSPLQAGRNARSVRLARIHRANQIGKQSPYRSGYGQYSDD